MKTICFHKVSCWKLADSSKFPIQGNLKVCFHSVIKSYFHYLQVNLTEFPDFSLVS